MSTFPLVDTTSRVPSRPRPTDVSIVPRKPSMSSALTIPARRPAAGAVQPALSPAASDELRNAASMEAQLNALLSLSQQGIELNSVISNSFKKSMEEKYEKVEAYSYSVLDLMRMQLMSRIALSAGTGKPAPGAIEMLDKIVSILRYIEQRQHDTPTHLEATKAITGSSPDVQGIVNKANARLLKAIEKHDTSIKSLEGVVKASGSQRTDIIEQLNKLRELVSINSANLQRVDKETDRLFQMTQRAPVPSVAPMPQVVPMAPVAPPMPQAVVEVPPVDHKAVADKAVKAKQAAEEKLRLHTERLKEKTEEVKKLKEQVIARSALVSNLTEQVRARSEAEKQIRDRLDKVVEKAGVLMRQSKKK